MYCTNANSIAWKSVFDVQVGICKDFSPLLEGGRIFFEAFPNSNFELFKHAPPSLEQPDTLALSNEDL